jgi:sugar phosphate isomerase/epimerase
VRLGLLTDCFVGWPLTRVVQWAAEHGYSDLEVAAWPRSVDDHATHLDVEAAEAAGIEGVADLVDAAGVHIAAVSYYDNLLDAERGDAARAHLIACCEAARRLGVGHVGTFVGRDPRRTVREDLAVAAGLLPRLVAEAARREVTLDPVEALRAHGRPALVQAKGIEVFPDRRNRTGYLGPVTGDSRPWWRYRTPGLDDLDWPRIITTLRDTGYAGPIIVEQEDPVLGRSEDGSARGLIAAHDHLAPLLG